MSDDPDDRTILPIPTAAIDDRIIQAFTIVSGMPQTPELRVLHTRLKAELVGDADAVAATLTPDFTLTMHNDAATVSLAADAVVDGVRAQASAGVLVWTEFDTLATGPGTVAGTGQLCVLAASTLTVTPMAFGIRFTGDKMCSETVLLAGGKKTDTLDVDVLPSLDQLRIRLA